MKKSILILLALVCSIPIAEAQFLKNLKKRVEERTKEVIEYKTADKAGQMTENALDKILNPNLEGLMKGGGKGMSVDASELPDNYIFEYRYAMKMSTSSGEMQFDYFLNPNESYLGYKMDMGMDLFSIIDEERKVIVNYIDGNPIATSMDIAENMDIEEDEYLEDFQNFTLTELPNKEFLGYDCIGREMENEQYKFTVYFATDMPANFDNVFNNTQTNLPPELQRFAEDYPNSLMMYMEMEDKENKGKKNGSATMECVAFESYEYTISNR
ncbi:hypothetical protein SAMN04488104_10616 [Algoriphagus faecimaris]|uniref:DUF4412 domain-containing protein n=1 Tax=Algoriphagus faecimaris TaxID=686796 RepID=A0A1G6XKN2_9BACT|nr:hypothetical protein [Algoriphagus faecimaris]SDD78632.1 hypothetical protein SAMN04488104_10616 [Algoriphagus faecimaris]